jgi:hypothetical protein
MDSSLNDVCYKQISENFYYGMFGDFQLVIDKDTGYFNAAKLCALGGKDFFDWKRLNRTRRLFKQLQAGSDGKRLVYEVRTSNKSLIEKQISGQYVQKDLFLDLASWVSTDFYIRCNKIVIDYFVREYTAMNIRTKTEKIKELELHTKNLELKLKQKADADKEQLAKLDEIIKQIMESKNVVKADAPQDSTTALLKSLLQHLCRKVETVEQQNDEILEKVETVQSRLDIKDEEHLEQLPSQERLVLVKRNDEDYPYQMIVAQRVSVKSKLRSQNSMYTDVKVMLDVPICSETSKTLLSEMTNRLKRQGVEIKYRKISLENSRVTEDELVNIMSSLEYV